MYVGYLDDSSPRHDLNGKTGTKDRQHAGNLLGIRSKIGRSDTAGGIVGNGDETRKTGITI